MSSPRTDSQGDVGDLRQQSREQLMELLTRQQKILSNRKLLQTLPDKGKKIAEFAEKLQHAIELRCEEEKRQSLVFDARAELQSKYRQAFTVHQQAVSATTATSNQNQQNGPVAGVSVQEKDTSLFSAHMEEFTTVDKLFISRAAAAETMETSSTEASVNSDGTKEGDLVEALERVTLSGTRLDSNSKESLNSKTRDSSSFSNYIPKKPHFVTVLEKNETSPVTQKQKFKPNQLASKTNTSPSRFSSPSQSSEGSSPLSAQARRERDRKHLDDITAAKLPPLHHSPAQLLSLEESAVLMKDQTKKQQELQAKLAAQKLSEGLKISMGSYTPDGGPMAAYREVHDEGAQLSSDED